MAFLTPLEVVILTRWADPSSVRKLKLLLWLSLSLDMFWVFTVRLLIVALRRQRSWVETRNKIVRGWLVNFILFIRVYESIKLLWDDTLKLGFIVAGIKVISWLLWCKSLSLRLFQSLMLKQRFWRIVMSERAQEILRLNHRRINIAPVIRRLVRKYWCRVFHALSWWTDLCAWKLRERVREFVCHLRLDGGNVIIKNGWGCEKQHWFESFNVIRLKAIVLTYDLICCKILSSFLLFWRDSVIGQRL